MKRQYFPHKMLTRLCLCLISSLLLVGVAQAKTSQVQLAVDLATPVMQADKAQTAFVKVALTGFKRESSQPGRIPANIAIVLDKSGSMQGPKLQRAKEAAIMAIERLASQDIVSVVTYDSSVQVVVPATKVTDRQSIARKIGGIGAGGSTALFAGVSKGSEELRKFLAKNRVNRVILLSDGLANVGPQTPSELGQLGMSLGKEGISVTTIGLGLGYNEDLMTQLAGYSDGNHAFVENETDLAKIFQYEFGDVLSVVAQGVDIHIRCADGIVPLRIIGRDGVVRGQNIQLSMNQLYSEQEKFVIIEVEIPAQKAGHKLPLAKVEVAYDNLVAKRSDQLNSVAWASFDASQEVVKRSINKEAYESSLEQVANEQSLKAIELRDQGDVQGAQEVLKSNAALLGSGAALIQSKRLQSQQQEALDDAEELQESDWNKKRKALKAKTYQRAKQQSY